MAICSGVAWGPSWVVGCGPPAWEFRGGGGWKGVLQWPHDPSWEASPTLLFALGGPV